MCHSKRESHPSYLFNPINPITLATISCPSSPCLNPGFAGRVPTLSAPGCWTCTHGVRQRKTSQPNNPRPTISHLNGVGFSDGQPLAFTSLLRLGKLPGSLRGRLVRNSLLKSYLPNIDLKHWKNDWDYVWRMVFKPYGSMRFIMQLVINSTCLPFYTHLCLHHSEKGPLLCLAYFSLFIPEMPQKTMIKLAKPPL